MTMRQGVRRSAAGGRSQRLRDLRHVPIPTAAELRAHYRQLAGYRFLVEILRSSPVMAASRFRDLARAEREAVDAFRLDAPLLAEKLRLDPQSVPKKKKCPKCFSDVLLVAAVCRFCLHRFDDVPALAPSVPKAFLLALAWALMDRENRKAARDLRVASVIKRVTRTYNCMPAILLQQSYLPKELDELLSLYLEAFADSRKEANQLRLYRGLVAYNRPIPRELHEAELMPTDQVRRWGKRFGFDKESGSLSRQQLWDWIARPLMKTFLEGREQVRQRERRRAKDEAGVKIPKAASWRAASRDVFNLLRARYPELPLPAPELIRQRFRRL